MCMINVNDQSLLDDSADHVICGGITEESDKYIAPTILANVSKNSKIMSEEIFGPLLPVFKYKDINEVINYINTGEKPLTLYVFTSNNDTVNRYGIMSIPPPFILYIYYLNWIDY